MATILLTNGRAPAALTLARVFHRAGHSVFTAESLPVHLIQPSAAVRANFVVPDPRRNFEAFIRTLKRIVEENQIQWLIPCGEEIFPIASRLGEFPCRVFAKPPEILVSLYDRWRFVLLAVEHRLRVPESIFIRSQDDLLHAFALWRGLILKPVRPHPASRTLILPTLKQALSTLTYSQPWIAQEFLPGVRYCAYAVCHAGRMTAHASSPITFTSHRGEAVVFRSVEHPAIADWMRAFAQRTGFTGQIAVEFIHTPDGRLFAIKAKPYAADVVQLLADHPRLAGAFLDADVDCITPLNGRSHMLAGPMLVNALPASILDGKFLHWLKTFFSSDDSILDYGDPLPFLLQWRSLFVRPSSPGAEDAIPPGIAWNEAQADDDSQDGTHP